MYRSYFVLAWRYLLKYKWYTTINLIGLTLGISCSLLVILFIYDELQFDKHFTEVDRIYRLNYQYKNETFAVTGFINWYDADKDEQLIKVSALKSINNVEQVAQFSATHSALIRKEPFYVSVSNGKGEPKKFTEKKILLSNTGEALIEIFQWPLIYGDQQTSFKGPYSAILTRESAERYFGEDWEQRIANESLNWYNEEYPITAVVDVEGNKAHFDFDLLLITPLIPTWGAYTYLKLSENASLQEINKEVNYQLALVEPSIVDNPDEKGSYLQKVTDIHLSNKILYELTPSGEIQYLYIFGIIGLIILFITVTNYINLSVALYSKRKNEIGMRKIMGAMRESITSQFLSEAILLCLISLPLILLLLHIVIPYFNQVMNLGLVNLYARTIPGFLLLFVFTLSIGFFSGIYPALLLSGKKAIQLMRNTSSVGRERFTLRRVMFVFQFTLLIALGSATIFVNSQLNFINHKNLGFSKEGIISFNPVTSEDYQRIKNKLLTYPQFNQMGLGMLPGQELSDLTSYKLAGSEKTFDNAGFWEMDWDALNVLGIQVTGIDQENAPEEVIILNESLSKNLLEQLEKDDKNTLLGRGIVTHLEYETEDHTYGQEYVIGGFVEDLHFLSLKEKINPMLIKIDKDPDNIYWGIIKLETDQLSESLRLLKDVYSEIVKDRPLEINFLESSLKELYEQEQRVGNLSFYLSIIAIIIAVLGLMSMSAYLVSLRTKEIGIRKVMGASVVELLMLLSKEFIMLVCIATVIATPFTYMFVNRWLSDFAYRIDVNLWVFLLTGFIALCIAVAVVILQTIKTANTKPAITLKSD